MTVSYNLYHPGAFFAWRAYVNGRLWGGVGDCHLSAIDAECAAFDAGIRACMVLP